MTPPLPLSRTWTITDIHNSVHLILSKSIFTPSWKNAIDGSDKDAWWSPVSPKGRSLVWIMGKTNCYWAADWIKGHLNFMKCVLVMVPVEKAGHTGDLFPLEAQTGDRKTLWFQYDNASGKSITSQSPPECTSSTLSACHAHRLGSMIQILLVFN